MSDPAHEPHGPEQLPDRQPPANPGDVTDQPALKYGASSRWLVPAGVLAAAAIVLFVLAFQLQLLLPIIGIVYVVVMWIAMFVVSRRSGDMVLRNRRLAWFMGALAVGALITFVAIYLVEATRPTG
jgi:hypothetical protein